MSKLVEIMLKPMFTTIVIAKVMSFIVKTFMFRMTVILKLDPYLFKPA